MVRKFRIGIEGKILGTIKIKWTYSFKIPESYATDATAMFYINVVAGWINEMSISSGMLRGKLFCYIEAY